MTEALVISRWIHFAAVFALFGSSFFWFYIGYWPPDSHGLARSFRATILLLRLAAAVAAFSGIVWLAAIIADMAGSFGAAADPTTLHLFFFETQFGPVAILRLALFALALAVAILPLQNRAQLSMPLVAGALLLVSQAWLGHAAEGGATFRGALMISTYAAHTLAGAAWVGGLAPLLFAFFEERRLAPREARARNLAMLSRFSRMGTAAVTLIVASGIANVVFHAADSWSKLLHSGYGMVLLAKLGLVAAMLVLAYFNRFVAMPRLRAAGPKGMMQLKGLGISVSFELAFGLLVIGAAAVLGITPPPH